MFRVRFHTRSLLLLLLPFPLIVARSRVHSGDVGRRLSVESRFGPESFESVLTQDDLRMLRGFYFILTEFEIKLVDTRGRVDYPPSGCLGVNEKALKVNLRFF